MIYIQNIQKNPSKLNSKKINKPIKTQIKDEQILH